MADIRNILDERGNRYGDYTRQAGIAQDLKEVARRGSSWGSMPTYQRESIEMLMTKVSRMVEGEFTNLDTLDDIIGYTTLIRDRIVKDREMSMTLNNYRFVDDPVPE